MRVEFRRGVASLGGFDLDAVPRAGDAVVFPRAEPMIAWGVTWWLGDGEPVAQVELVTERERDRRIRR